MDLDVTTTKTKFTYVGEILPNNDRSNAILAQRRDEEQRRREEAERVSAHPIKERIPCRGSSFRQSFHKCQFHFNRKYNIDQAAAGAGREGEEEEGTRRKRETT